MYGKNGAASNFQKVQDFREATEQQSAEHPFAVYPVDAVLAQIDCVKEEAHEFNEELAEVEWRLRNGARVEGALLARAVQEAIDTIYVNYGFLASIGVDADSVFDLIHEANMKKANGPIAPNGKRLKPAGWQKPNVAQELCNQANEAQYR